MGGSISYTLKEDDRDSFLKSTAQAPQLQKHANGNSFLESKDLHNMIFNPTPPQDWDLLHGMSPTRYQEFITCLNNEVFTVSVGFPNFMKRETSSIVDKKLRQEEVIRALVRAENGRLKQASKQNGFQTPYWMFVEATQEKHRLFVGSGIKCGIRSSETRSVSDSSVSVSVSRTYNVPNSFDETEEERKFTANPAVE